MNQINKAYKQRLSIIILELTDKRRKDGVLTRTETKFLNMAAQRVQRGL